MVSSFRLRVIQMPSQPPLRRTGRPFRWQLPGGDCESDRLPSTRREVWDRVDSSARRARRQPLAVARRRAAHNPREHARGCDRRRRIPIVRTAGRRVCSSRFDRQLARSAKSSPFAAREPPVENREFARHERRQCCIDGMAAALPEGVGKSSRRTKHERALPVRLHLDHAS